MKKWTLVSALIILSFSLTSCFKTEDDSSSYNVMATLVTADSYDYPSFKVDAEYTLNSTNKITAESGFFEEKGRYYLSFTFGDTTNQVLKTYPIKIKKIWKSTIKDFVTVDQDATDTYKNCGIQALYLASVRNNYVDMIFNTYTSTGTKDDYELVRMKGYEDNNSQDIMPTIYFELRHNVVGIDTTGYNSRIASFDISSLITEFPLATSFNIDLKWYTYGASGQTEYVYSYDVSELTSLSAICISNGN
jgi:hypothetical protein